MISLRRLPEAVEREWQQAQQEIARRGLSLGSPLFWLHETTSTNDKGKAGAKAGVSHGAVWVAEFQRQGRGRQGRQWFCPLGEGLTFSVLLRVLAPISNLPLLALATGLVVHHALELRIIPARLQIKWPNDIWLEGKKVAGVLVESSPASSEGERAVIIGIGINVSVRSFPEEFADRVTSLVSFAAHPISRSRLLVDILAGMEEDVLPVVHEGLGYHLLERLKQVDALKGRYVSSKYGEGEVMGIDDEGCLQVLLRNGNRIRFKAGEVHLSEVGTKGS
ncbi:biotin--[acetyl-CoA-carboxylase] ligase [Pajaroellobacter abortibovis]|uniref:Biotin--[acetyl-CoA-carboxylase] ligase n=1 Tax=Pajaroellobacter abortibovis TaxID=1882918 RepID=A0A1L6MVI7_9BACT|nr:biotin--[acetyl-CoA-carboxylase] ligase [Pajaroellobacter abortibovis]APR99437.1 biotin--[acetyl-CoA-carboxylase] ligase [Pajaroellobacter abortibovis]